MNFTSTIKGIKIQDLFLYVLLVLLSLLSVKFLLSSSWLVFAILGIIFFLAFFFGQIKKGVLFLFFIRPIIDLFWAQDVSLVGHNPLYIIGFIVPLLAISYLLARRKNPFALPGSKVVLLFLFSQVISLLYTMIAHPRFLFNDFTYFMRVINGFVLFLTVPFLVDTKEDIRVFTEIVLVSTLVPIGVTFFQGISGSPASIQQYGEFSRFKGVFQAPYNPAWYSLLAVLLSFYKLDEKKKGIIQRIGLVLLILIASFTLFRTYLRAGWIMLVLGLGLWFYFRNKKVALAAFTILICLLVITIPSIQKRFHDEINYVFGQGELAKIGSGRGGQWISYWYRYENFPLVEKVVGRSKVIGLPENQILWQLVHFGIMGLCSYFLLVVIFAHRLLRFIRNFNMGFPKRFIIFALILHLIFFLSAGIGANYLKIVNTQWVLWSVIGIALRQAKRESGSSDG